MTKYDIINQLATDKAVERIVRTYRIDNPYVVDLSQDIYVDLLTKDAGLIERLHNDGTLLYFIAKMVRNNLCSVNSPYYYDYQRFRRKTVELNEKIGL